MHQSDPADPVNKPWVTIATRTSWNIEVSTYPEDDEKNKTWRTLLVVDDVFLK
jgi:hypothetical protein